MNRRYPFAPGVIVGGPRRYRRLRWLSTAAHTLRCVATVLAWAITISAMLVLVLIAASMFAMAFAGWELFEGARAL